MPSFPNTLRMYHSTVRGLRKNSAPISLFVGPSPGAPGDLQLLWGQVGGHLHPALAYGLADGQQLATGTFGEPVQPHRTQHFVGAMELLASIDAAVLAAEPLIVEQMRASQVDAGMRLAQTLDSRLVQIIGGLPAAQHRRGARPDAECPSPVLDGLLGRRKCLPILAQAVVKHPVGHFASPIAMRSLCAASAVAQCSPGERSRLRVPGNRVT